MTLRCPVCSADALQVKDTRQDTCDGIVRKRECPNGHTFRTVEKVWHGHDKAMLTLVADNQISASFLAPPKVRWK